MKVTRLPVLVAYCLGNISGGIVGAIVGATLQNSGLLNIPQWALATLCIVVFGAVVGTVALCMVFWVADTFSDGLCEEDLEVA